MDGILDNTWSVHVKIGYTNASVGEGGAQSWTDKNKIGMNTDKLGLSMLSDLNAGRVKKRRSRWRDVVKMSLIRDTSKFQLTECSS